MRCIVSWSMPSWRAALLITCSIVGMNCMPGARCEPCASVFVNTVTPRNRIVLGW
jgi:hypothetical protein